MMLLSLTILVGLLLFGFILNETFAEEPIIITEANPIQIIDGKWGFVSEWKESAYTGLSYDNGGKLILRTSHDRNNIYVLIDNLADIFPNRGEDRATICLSSKDIEKSDYCFIVTLGRKNSIVLEENPLHTTNSKFKRIFRTEFVGASDITIADRYSVVPHVTYEFKIPIDLVGRSNEYQFYVSVYEAQNNYVLTWPKYIILKNNFDIPSSSNWGTMISPDSSLPEFPLSFSILIIPMMIIVIISKIKGNFFK